MSEANQANRYDVIVGNVGTVYSGNDEAIASKIFGEYVEQSESGVGRAGGECVTLMDNDEIVLSHGGDQDKFNSLDEFLDEILGEDAKYFKI